MKFYDAFAGVGGFHLGITQAHPDWECAGACEIDKHCQGVYKKHFSGVEIDADIRKVDKLPEGTDMLCGGFPCQDLSIAGKRKGLAGQRSGLFYELARLAKISQPSVLFFENVKGLLSSNEGWDFFCILSELEEIGYSVQWAVLNTSDLLPQNRERVFIIGTLGEGCPQKVFPIQEGNLLPDTEQGESEPTACALTSSDYKGVSKQRGNCVAISPELNQIGAIGKDSEATRVYSPDGIARTIKDGGGMGTKTGLYAVPVLTPNRMEKRQNGRRFKENGEPMFTLNAQDNHGVYLDNFEIRRLTPRECEKLQGFPPDWTRYSADGKEVSDSQRYRMMGNAVSVPVIAAVARQLI